jgi:NAD(P)H-hydrate epimerase
MAYVFTPSQMKTLDENTINCFGIPASILMENAGRGCADFLINNYPEESKGVIIILHGYGNNSGDGFVLARWLQNYGKQVILLQVQKGEMTEETRHNFKLCKALKMPTFELNKEYDNLDILENVPGVTMIIDAVFGTGFKGKLPASLKKIFQSVDDTSALKVAIDIPSGLNGATGEGEDAFRADVTLTLHSYKMGFFLREGKIKCGKVYTIPIGIPEHYNDAFFTPAIFIDNKTFRLPERYYYANKSNYGRVFIIGGSYGLLGAAALATRAALRAGAGLVYLISREENKYFYNANPAEFLFIGIPRIEGTLTPDLKLFTTLFKTADSVVIGPGLGSDNYGTYMLEYILRTSTVPTVVDADALRIIAKDPSLQQYLKKPNILLTPHLGEFCTLTDMDMDKLVKDIPTALENYIKKTGAKVLLKSDTTIFSDGKRMFINISGNDGLATGGSGDVLAGIIGSFCGQKMELGEAAINASFIMGKTAEELAKQRYFPSILPTDIIENLFMPLKNESLSSPES